LASEKRSCHSELLFGEDKIVRNDFEHALYAWPVGQNTRMYSVIWCHHWRTRSFVPQDDKLKEFPKSKS